MGKEYFKHLRNNRTKLKGLAKDFLANKLSAAGVSYIVDENTRLRRTLWFIGVIGCCFFMGYMTLNVISEYLDYPKMLIKEDVIKSRLPFPAVTVCSLNPISERYANYTSLKNYWKLTKLLNEALPATSRIEIRNKCMQEPLCRWSWFQESCTCVDNPCRTEFCMASNDSYCVCSSAICDNKSGYACYDFDENSDPWNKSLCFCDSTQAYNSTVPKIEQSNLVDILSRIKDSGVRNIIKLVRNSNSFDLSDIEEALLPSLAEIYEYGIPFDSLVASCSFEKVYCDRENFSILYHPKYGKCYMFNYVGGSSTDAEQPIDANNYGSNSGLNMLLRIMDQDVLDLVRKEVGARIVIHDPNRLPFVAEYGVNVKPSDMTAVSVSMSTMNRLPDPWGDCLDKPAHDNDKEPYSILECEKRCGFDHMTRNCNCTMRHLMHGSVLTSSVAKYPLCNLSNPEQKECVERIVKYLEEKIFDCNCKPPCFETIYSFSVTSSELNENYFKMVKAIRTMTVTPDGNLAYYINTTDKKSMIGVKVYYNTFQVSQQSEVKSYSWETLVANIGGNMGFFMGLTIITFMEIVEFLWDVIGISCKPPEENKVYTVPKTSKRILSLIKHTIKGEVPSRRKSI